MHLHHGCCDGHRAVAAMRRPGMQASYDPAAAFERDLCLNLADGALRLAGRAGADYADIRIGGNEREWHYAREHMLKSSGYGLEAGFGVRVLL
jgi:hypothetical protein